MYSHNHFGRYHDDTSSNQRDMIYDAPRFTIGSDTRELIIPLGRTFETGFSTVTLSIVLVVKRRSMDSDVEFEWNPYAIKDGRAHFEIPDELISDADTFPRGMYDLSVIVAGCTIANLEMIKAPSYFVRGVQVRESKDGCETELAWVEPPCVEEPKKCHILATCPVDPDSGCQECVKTYHVAEVTLKSGYGL